MLLESSTTAKSIKLYFTTLHHSGGISGGAAVGLLDFLNVCFDIFLFLLAVHCLIIDGTATDAYVQEGHRLVLAQGYSLHYEDL